MKEEDALRIADEEMSAAVRQISRALLANTRIVEVELRRRVLDELDGAIASISRARRSLRVRFDALAGK